MKINLNKKGLYWLALLIVAGLGAAIRFYDLTDLPLDIAVARQMRSAVIARGIYYQWLPEDSEGRRFFALNAAKDEGLIEPPILEGLAALAYRITGVENLWYARVFSILFWLVGGVALFFLCLEVSGAAAGLLVLVYFLFLPFGALNSRTFQPDPLMVSLFCGFFLSAARWGRLQNSKWAMIAGLFGGAAILVKSVIVFPVAFGSVAIVLSTLGLRKAIRSRQVWVLAGLLILPYAIYLLYGLVFTRQLQGQFSLRFFPQLWLDPAFYLRWQEMIARVLEWPWFLISLIGLACIKSREGKVLLAASWIGYFIYGMTLDYHITTHDYYQLPAVALVANGLGSLAGWVYENLPNPKIVGRGLLILAAAAWMVLNAWNVRVELKQDDARGASGYWQNFGAKFDPQQKIAGLVPNYGYPLTYWGWRMVNKWPYSGDFTLYNLAGNDIDMKERFTEITEGADIFLVMDLREFDSQPFLKKTLTNGYPLLEQTDNYLIFDLNHAKSSP